MSYSLINVSLFPLKMMYPKQGGLTYEEHTQCSSWSTWDQQWEDMDQFPDLVAERNALFGGGRQCFNDLWNESYGYVDHLGKYDERLFTDKILQKIDNSDQSDKPFYIHYMVCCNPFAEIWLIFDCPYFVTMMCNE